MNNDLDFNCDRQSKNDFTASTVSYWAENNKTIVKYDFYERDMYGYSIPYGSNSAYTQSRADIWFTTTTSAHTYNCVIELKERSFKSTGHFNSAFINEEKIAYLTALRLKGYRIYWGELYTDNHIRIWDLTNVDFTQLKRVKKWIKKTNIDPNSKKKPQWRREIPYDKGFLIRRIAG